MKKNKLLILALSAFLTLGLTNILNAESTCQSNVTNLRKRIDILENELKQVAKDTKEKCNDPSISTTSDMSLPKLMFTLAKSSTSNSNCVLNFIAKAAQKQLGSGRVKAILDDLNIYFDNPENEACKKDYKQLILRLNDIYKSTLGQQSIIEQMDVIQQKFQQNLKSYLIDTQ